MQRLTLPSSAFLFIVLFVSIMLFQSCVDHDLNNLSCPDISFEADVQEIIIAKCAIPSCHNGSIGASLDWTDFGTLQAKTQNGVVKRRVVNLEMPPSYSLEGPLTASEIEIIACWADQGAKDN